MKELYIKNMVCNRCIMVVKSELGKLGHRIVKIKLGEVELEHDISAIQKQEIESAMMLLGFELIDDKKSRLVEKIKTTIIRLVHYPEWMLQTNLSDYLSNELHLEYNYLSGIFSEFEGSTIEKYYIAQKIERVKELLVYDELTLSEIADQMHYSSVAYLSNQFKKVTGLTPGYYKQIGEHKRKPLDKL